MCVCWVGVLLELAGQLMDGASTMPQTENREIFKSDFFDKQWSVGNILGRYMVWKVVHRVAWLVDHWNSGIGMGMVA